MSDNWHLTICFFLALVFLTIYQRGCIEHTQNNDTYYLEKLRIEEAE